VCAGMKYIRGTSPYDFHEVHARSAVGNISQGSSCIVNLPSINLSTQLR
jgi:hypothetical protein